MICKKVEEKKITSPDLRIAFIGNYTEKCYFNSRSHIKRKGI
jgi:hypothetical protein